MTDFTQNFAAENLMIRDTGPLEVGFLVYVHNQGSSFPGTSFAITVNGSTGTYTVNIPAGAGWFLVANINALYTQFVTFAIGADSFTVHVVRERPDPPSQPTLSNIKINAIDVAWGTSPYPGSSPITGYQLGYGTDPSGPTTTINATSPKTASNLATGTVYYFWVRAVNAVGAGDWSVENSAKTYLGAYVNVGGVWKLAIPYVKVSGIWKQAEPIVNHV